MRYKNTNALPVKEQGEEAANMANIDCEKCFHYKVCCAHTSKEIVDKSNHSSRSLPCDYYTPTAEVVEVRRDFNVGDFCLYGFADGNKSLAIVEIVKILDDERGIAEIKFHKVIKDNTGNGFFNYLLKNGGTMNGSFKYLKNITPKVDGERSEK